MLWNGNGVAKQIAMHMAYALTDATGGAPFISLEGSLGGYSLDRIANPVKYGLDKVNCFEIPSDADKTTPFLNVPEGE